MFLTKECDYSIRIVRALADKEKRTVKTICDMEYIPHQYAYKILKKLERAGFVQSCQGPGGGYQLIRSLHSFTLYDVIAAVDNDLFLFECTRKGYTCPRNSSELPCAIHQEFSRLQSLLMEEMQSKSLGEVLAL